jgi:hypothetical protein
MVPGNVSEYVAKTQVSGAPNWRDTVVWPSRSVQGTDPEKGLVERLRPTVHTPSNYLKNINQLYACK